MLCSVCDDEARDAAILMVVPRESDLDTVEKSGTYRGRYFVLGGTIPLLADHPERTVRLTDLAQTVNERVSTLHEIIIAMDATPDGEHTEAVVREWLESRAPGTYGLTRLGRGLSTGVELEYSDKETLRNALSGRTRI
jgi:recombination protein RecR